MSNQEIKGHDELSYVKRNLEAWTDRALTAESSLELTVKALEKVFKMEGYMFVKDTLDQIRGEKT